MAVTHPFAQVDVFTAEALFGNPVAVVLDPTGVSTQRMHEFTTWTNLSETTFVGPPTNPDADYSVRIFCPGRELPFAGHPTLGSCHAWLAAGGVPKRDYVVQECGAGLVRIRRDGPRLAFAAPPRDRSGPLTEAELAETIEFLGVTRDDVQRLMRHRHRLPDYKDDDFTLRNMADIQSALQGTTQTFTLLLGIVGGSGSGKTAIAQELLRRMRER